MAIRESAIIDGANELRSVVKNHAAGQSAGNGGI